MLTFGSLFAGIGGFDLGFERAGMRCVWQVEIDEYCRRVLAKHWSNVKRWDDVKTFPPEGEDFERPDVICGGFPCQDISNAGNQAGIAEGTRSGLWSEYARIVGVVRPRYVVVENVAALLHRGLGRVLGDLAACGYDAEWDCIPAAAVGAPHRRDRLFIVAYAKGQRCVGLRQLLRQAGRDPAKSRRAWRTAGIGSRQEDAAELAGHGADSASGRRDATSDSEQGRSAEVDGFTGPQQTIAFGRRDRIDRSQWWLSEPGVDRVVDGISPPVDRLRGLGNAVVPQVAEWIGRRLMAT